MMTSSTQRKTLHIETNFNSVTFRSDPVEAENDLEDLVGTFADAHLSPQSSPRSPLHETSVVTHINLPKLSSIREIKELLRQALLEQLGDDFTEQDLEDRWSQIRASFTELRDGTLVLKGQDMSHVHYTYPRCPNKHKTANPIKNVASTRNVASVAVETVGYYEDIQDENRPEENNTLIVLQGQLNELFGDLFKYGAQEAVYEGQRVRLTIVDGQIVLSSI